MSWEQVEQAWQLSDDARDFGAKVGGQLTQAQYWDQFFAASELVDVERTKKEGGEPLAKIFLKSPYGLIWRDQYKDWIPFRHGEVKLEAI